MTAKDFLDETAHVVASDIEGDDGKIYVSNFDNSYITRVGMEEDINFLASREITKDLTHGVGFSPKYSKWYGWSHRAIYGFEVGSTCSKGDCHYMAANEEDEIEAAGLFCSGDNHTDVCAKKVKDGLIHVSWRYDDKTPNEKLRGQIGGADWEYDINFGRGEWTAKTQEDAKQMAIDFNRSVS